MEWLLSEDCESFDAEAAKETTLEIGELYLQAPETLETALIEIADELIESINDENDVPFTSCHWHESVLGIWPNIEGAKEECEFTSSQEQEWPADDYEGEWLHVNDHGNATLYNRSEGEDQEIWSAV